MPIKREIEYQITETGCWECTSHTTCNGYPVITIKRKLVYLHRFVYEQNNGVIPPNMITRHKCDNRRCINPAHLEIGTVNDNVQDRVRRNRGACGEHNGAAKLTAIQVIEIRNNTDATRILAAQYGVSKSQIRDIRSRRRWKHIAK